MTAETRSPPQGKLRNRVTLYFLLVAFPAVLVSVASVILIDAILRDEIRRRGEGVALALREYLGNERRRVTESVSEISTGSEMRGLADLLDAEDVIDRLEPLASEKATARGLDLLAIVALRGPLAGQIVSSAHLPSAVGDPAPSFANGGVFTATAGFAIERVAGNPPVLEPAMIATEVIRTPDGSPALRVYGGVRIAQSLRDLGRMGNAQLVIEAPGLHDDEAPVLAGNYRRVRSVDVPVIEGAADPKAPPGDARIRVWVRAGTLEVVRSYFVKVAAVAMAMALFLAIVLGSVLSRRITTPIVELSRAAEEIARGNLSVRLLPRTNDEVGALVHGFNGMAAELAESRSQLQRAERIAAWREIARRVAHEIKNPLFPIQMSVETLRKSYRQKHPKLDEIVEESTTTVLEEVRALNRIVTEFSDFARLPAPRMEPINAAALFDHLEQLYPSTGRALVEVDRSALGNVTAWQGDKEQISRILINLVKNAFEAMAEPNEQAESSAEGAQRGVVRLSAAPETRAETRGVMLVVADNGRGIPGELRDKLFTPYFTTKTKGTGLGLAIVDRIVQEHGGAITWESSVGEGTTFRIWLPINPPPPTTGD